MKQMALVGMISLAIAFGAKSVVAGTITYDGVDYGTVEWSIVGELDSLEGSTTIGSTELPTSSTEDELNWLNDVLGTSYDTLWRDETLLGDWVNVIDDASLIDGEKSTFWAYEYDALFTPDYFLVKVGGGSDTNPKALDGNTHFLFKNLEKLQWAVVDLGGGEDGLDFARPYDITGISHMSAPVPEPATMLLFGIGLVSLAGVRIRRKKK